jgi:TonB family protein
MCRGNSTEGSNPSLSATHHRRPDAVLKCQTRLLGLAGLSTLLLSVNLGLAEDETSALVGNYDRAPTPLKITKPQYPQEAFEQKIEGTVVLEMLVDADGRVHPRRILTSVLALNAAAIDCVREWRFNPATKGGKPVATMAHAPVGFRIRDTAPKRRHTKSDFVAGQKACDDGSREECYKTGLAYARSDGVTGNAVSAAELFKRACDSGFAEACGALGWAYDSGFGIERDLVQAVALHRAACDGKVAEGCYSLGMAYARGEGTEKDLAAAARFLRLACDSGFKMACREKLPSN